jgi:hypothetical protein
VGGEGGDVTEEQIAWGGGDKESGIGAGRERGSKLRNSSTQASGGGGEGREGGADSADM